jgi:hypothetical protein
MLHAVVHLIGLIVVIMLIYQQFILPVLRWWGG